MLRGLITIGHGYAHSAEQVYGTIPAPARTEHYADSGNQNRLHGGTVNALVKRGLVESIDVRTRGAYRYATLALTDAGWAALGAAYGVVVRPVKVAPPAATDSLFSDAQQSGDACVACAGDLSLVASVPAGRGPRGQVFRCLGCSDASDAQSDEVDAPGEEPDSESEPVLGGGEGSIVDGWPADSGDLLRMAVTDILDGFTPMTCEPLRTATVPRASGGDGAYAPTAHPADPDGGSPFWLSVPRVRLAAPPGRTGTAF